MDHRASIAWKAGIIWTSLCKWLKVKNRNNTMCWVHAMCCVLLLEGTRHPPLGYQIDQTRSNAASNRVMGGPKWPGADIGVSKHMAMGQNLWYHIWVDEHPFTSYFDVHQGYRVLTHNHMKTTPTFLNLVICDSLLLNMTIEIIDFPINSNGSW